MIYTQTANFPYPLLVNDTKDYIDPTFEFDVNLAENQADYAFSIDYTIGSDFLKNLIQENKASLILIIKSKDNQFHKLNEWGSPTLQIPKSRLSLDKKTTLQLMIQSNEKISFSDNMDLDDFYKEYQSEITVNHGNALGFSNIIIFDGSQNKPHDLFEKKVDPNITSDIEIKLSSETIKLIFKDSDIELANFHHVGSDNLKNPYLYLGLQKALINFIHNNANDDNKDEIEDIQNFDQNNVTLSLERKLLILMQKKQIKSLNMDNIDEVIHLISDNIIRKYISSLKDLKDES